MVRKPKNEIIKKIIELIKKKRLESKMSQSQLSRMSGVDQAYISRLEREQKPGVSLEMASRLMRALNIKWAELDEL